MNETSIPTKLNRRQRRAAAAQERRTPAHVRANVSALRAMTKLRLPGIVLLHPTKGYRSMSARRLRAQRDLPLLAEMHLSAAANVR